MKWLARILSGLLLSAPLSAGELSVPGGPAGLDMLWIARYMEFNDLPMSIQSFKSPIKLDDLLPELEAYLDDFGKKVQITVDPDGWTVLATGDDDRFFSIRLKEQLQDTEGVFTVSARKSKSEGDIPLPLGFVRIEKQKFFDGPSIQEFIVLATAAGQSAALADVERMLRSEGWNSTRNYRSTRYFSRNNERAQAMAQPGEQGVGTLILISKELSK
ncbi:MAG: hypothetical protein ACK5ME_10955 [Parahaliea sp.]